MTGERIIQQPLCELSSALVHDFPTRSQSSQIALWNELVPRILQVLSGEPQFVANPANENRLIALDILARLLTMIPPEALRIHALALSECLLNLVEHDNEDVAFAAIKRYYDVSKVCQKLTEIAATAERFFALMTKRLEELPERLSERLAVLGVEHDRSRELPGTAVEAVRRTINRASALAHDRLGWYSRRQDAPHTPSDIIARDIPSHPRRSIYARFVPRSLGESSAGDKSCAIITSVQSVRVTAEMTVVAMLFWFLPCARVLLPRMNAAMGRVFPLHLRSHVAADAAALRTLGSDLVNAQVIVQLYDSNNLVECDVVSDGVGEVGCVLTTAVLGRRLSRCSC